MDHINQKRYNMGVEVTDNTQRTRAPNTNCAINPAKCSKSYVVSSSLIHLQESGLLLQALNRRDHHHGKMASYGETICDEEGDDDDDVDANNRSSSFLCTFIISL